MKMNNHKITKKHLYKDFNDFNNEIKEINFQRIFVNNIRINQKIYQTNFDINSKINSKTNQYINSLKRKLP